MRYVFLFAWLLAAYGCKKNSPNVPPVITDTAYYFPPADGEWQSKSAADAGWDEAALQAAFDYAATRQTYGMVLLHRGKIVKEQYWNNWTKDTRYYLASAGKSVLGFVAGIAQQEALIDINRKTSDYLGIGWTSLPRAKEDLITVRHQLTMTTGLDDAVADPDCLDPGCLTYKADAGTRWAYHNAPYRLLQEVMSQASGKSWNQYCKEKLFTPVGMQSAFWLDHIMYCNTRDAARFGSLILRRGEWNGKKILNDPAYFNAMVNTSQTYNLSYGYLWWLNGKQSAMVPQSQIVFPTSLAPAAPADMLMALGKGDKKIYVVPSLQLVLVRLGDDAGGALSGPSGFDNDLWTRLKPALKY